jgi:hypothetical protein
MEFHQTGNLQRARSLWRDVKMGMMFEIKPLIWSVILDLSKIKP